jgi:Flp pilus assembly protein TadG
MTMFGALRHIADYFGRDERGATLVEMTLIAPLMILISAGVFEFGNAIHQKMLMQAGLNDAARFAARCNSQMYTDYGVSAINCADIAANIAVFGNPSGTGSARVSGWVKANVTVEMARCLDAVANGVTLYRSVKPQVCVVRVRNSKPYDSVGLLAAIGIGPITLTGVHEERLIRF